MVADARDGRHLHAPPVLGAGDLARHRKPRGLGFLAGLAVVGGSRELHDLGRRGELLAAVECGEQRHAHQDGRGHARQERAGKPARRNLPPVGRSAAAVGKQRRLVAEFGYGSLDFVHSERRLLPLPVPRLFMFVAATIACREGRSQRRREPFAGFALSIHLHATHASASPAEDCKSLGRQWGRNRAPLWRGSWSAKPLTLRHAGRRFRRPEKTVAKNSKNFEIGVDTRRGWRLYTPHNEGGAPLATKEFALVKSKRAA